MSNDKATHLEDLKYLYSAAMAKENFAVALRVKEVLLKYDEKDSAIDPGEMIAELPDHVLDQLIQRLEGGVKSSDVVTATCGNNFTKRPILSLSNHK